MPDINFAYSLWDSQPGNPLAANYVAASIKQLLYDLAPAYPNLQYLVIVGDDRMIPFRRIRDEALFANERYYAPTAYTPILSSSLGLRFFLSDDYYAGLLPLPFKGRELYLPQVAHRPAGGETVGDRHRDRCVSGPPCHLRRRMRWSPAMIS